jgi:hypothetical protein
MISKKAARLQDQILQDNAIYPAQIGEQNLKSLIANWNAQITCSELYNMLVDPNDTVKTKGEIARDLKVLQNNSANFRISNGFKDLEINLGVDRYDILLKDKHILDSQTKSYRKKTPPYSQRKKLVQAEWTERLKDTQHLIEKVAKTRQDIKNNQKSKKLRQAKREEQFRKSEELNKIKQEEEQEALRLKKLDDIGERKKKYKERKHKHHMEALEYQKKFAR